MITRQYPIMCPSCSGSGLIQGPSPMSTTAFITCPACNGNKTVMVTETVYGNEDFKSGVKVKFPGFIVHAWGSADDDQKHEDISGPLSFTEDTHEQIIKDIGSDIEARLDQEDFIHS